MHCIQRILFSSALFLSASTVLQAAEPQDEHPADPKARALPLNHDPGPLSTYIEPKLRGEGPEAIERSDFANALSAGTGSTDANPDQEKKRSGKGVPPGGAPGARSGHGAVPAGRPNQQGAP